MSEIEERLCDVVRNLKRKNETLELELESVRSALDRADCRINQELEPRIKREERAYDAWALSPERS